MRFVFAAILAGCMAAFAPGRFIVVARKNRKCGTYDCAHDNTVVFEGGRTIAISLDDIGP